MNTINVLKSSKIRIENIEKKQNRKEKIVYVDLVMYLFLVFDLPIVVF